ncbi:uncharacterized protein LOC121649462 [Melanotaenia boesemani]|uniref:uncharacterized protein LOC121649462 n=1 Tax=Melanotaenia boesemani TaxID=1250792 RepID=UPI001C05C4DE|nr:uncharacterized protein LOC121649462 [Melanotaenia boesemani]
MPWVKAREFCQRHYVDLAVLSSEEQYFTLLNTTLANKVSFWLGLRRQSIISGWTWVSGEELGYEHWYRKNYEGCCASLEAMLEKENKLLARYCDELHMTVCQGPVSPPSVKVGLVGTDFMNLSWNVSAVMLMTSHSYNVTICYCVCETLLYPYTSGSSLMSISISNLTSATKYFIQISAVVVRLNNVTGIKTILQDNPATLLIKTAKFNSQVNITLKMLKIMLLGPPLWILYRVLKKDDFTEAVDERSLMKLSSSDAVVDWFPQKTRGFGLKKEGEKHILNAVDTLMQ